MLLPRGKEVNAKFDLRPEGKGASIQKFKGAVLYSCKKISPDSCS